MRKMHHDAHRDADGKLRILTTSIHVYSIYKFSLYANWSATYLLIDVCICLRTIALNYHSETKSTKSVSTLRERSEC